MIDERQNLFEQPLQLGDACALVASVSVNAASEAVNLAISASSAASRSVPSIAARST